MGLFSLNQTISWSRALAATSTDDAATLAMLSDLQGNILKGHGRDHTIHLFLCFKTGASAQVKTFLRDLGNKMPSALDQLTKTQLFKTINQDGGLFIAAFLSSQGYQALGLNSAQPTGAAFRAGMKQRAALLHDSDPSHWDPYLAGAVHVMILLAHDNEQTLAADSQALQQQIAALNGAITVLGQETGLVQRNKDTHGLEHFGYVDGRSQPLMLQEDIEAEKKAGGIDQWDPTIPLSQVLVRCPGGTLDVSYGSYFVFRKLEQNVKGFKTKEQALRAKLNKDSGHDPDELAGAFVVGRFENGTPVEVSPVEQPVTTDSLSVPNNFNFDADPAGQRCPYAAHIRKTNPRDKSIRSTSRLMARRGITYGKRTDPLNDGQLDNKPQDKVGLLFMAYQSSLENQFEFTQQSWANNAKFHFGSPSQPVGIDPVIGQPPGGTGQRYPLTYGAPPLSDPFDFSGFVTLKGGEYFFAPSLSFFKAL
ncbi:MAG: Dyp-type peroxidase [Burkholderiaceae bacterium]